MMKKLTYLLPLLVLFTVTCGGDFTEMDVGLDGKWIAQSGVELLIHGVGFTRTAANGTVETGTIAAAGGYITFSRIGYSSETKEYTFNFPQLKIGEIMYYYDSPSEPVDIVATWYSQRGMSPALVFFPGKRVKDENKRDTPAREGDFIWFGYFKGRYMISNRNLPNSSILVLTTTHIHGSNLWSFVFAEGLPLDLQELFDFSAIEVPSTVKGITDWWFSLEEVRNFFDVAANRTTDIVKKGKIYEEMEAFLDDYKIEGVYSYFTSYDPAARVEDGLVNVPGEPNRLVLLQGGDEDRFYRSAKEWEEIWEL